MDSDPRSDGLSRRRFMQHLATVAVASRALLSTRDARAAAHAVRVARGDAKPWPAMAYRKLGRTGFDASRLVMGCGASLMWRRKDALLEAAYEAGVNTFDVGYSGYYRNAEKHLAPFLGKVRDHVFLISKAPAGLDVEPDQEVTVAEAKEAAARWSQRLDESLRELEVERVDAYYLMASYNPSFIESEEVQAVFSKARDLGKVSYLGLSTHRNAEKVLLAAARTGAYDLAMIAITPAGWYDWKSKRVLDGTPPLRALRPVLEEARAAGIGLVGMKAARTLSGIPILRWAKPDAFDAFYDEKLLSAPLSPFQRSYAFVLEHGLDVVNADIQSFANLEENVAAAASAPTWFT